ncbi:hypothetical protein [Streptomyces sp.]|uniref:hypothetical protein n=1 Tax=Streptomyces sp. TaxID=1931 RepID=UPI002F42B308
MELERVRLTVLRGTFHVYELAALVAAARYVTDSPPPEMPAQLLEQLRGLLDEYDEQVRDLSLCAPARPQSRK